MTQLISGQILEMLLSSSIWLIGPLQFAILLIVAIQYFTHVLGKPTSSSKPSNDSLPLIEKQVHNQPQQCQLIIEQLNLQKNANRGLKNLGNSCYMNCVLQCLHKSKYLTYNFHKELQRRGQSYLQNNCNTLTSYYHQLITQLWQKTQHQYPYSPQSIKKIVAQSNFMFHQNQQNDATEFLSTLLSVMSRQLDTSPQQKKYEDIDRSKVKDQSQILKMTKQMDAIQRHSIIQDTLTGMYRTCYHCLQCKYDYVMFQKFNIHYVRIPTLQTSDNRDGKDNNEEYDLMECFSQFEKADKLVGDDRMTCDKCGKETDTDKTMKICEANKIFVVAIQRFLRGGKDRRKVRVPRELTQQNKRYHLYAACLHFGSLNRGHYTAVCFNYKTNKWINFNDSRWEQIDSFEIINFQNAYALFYEHCESKGGRNRG